MGTSHHWNLKGRRREGRVKAQVIVLYPPSLCRQAPHSSSPDGHEVEDVRHPWAVAQEAANADLEHNGNHQDPVPVGEGDSERLGTETNPPSEVGEQEELGEVKCHSRGKVPDP